MQRWSIERTQANSCRVTFRGSTELLLEDVDYRHMFCYNSVSSLFLSLWTVSSYFSLEGKRINCSYITLICIHDWRYFVSSKFIIYVCIRLSNEVIIFTFRSTIATVNLKFKTWNIHIIILILHCCPLFSSVNAQIYIYYSHISCDTTTQTAVQYIVIVCAGHNDNPNDYTTNVIYLLLQTGTNCCVSDYCILYLWVIQY